MPFGEGLKKTVSDLLAELNLIAMAAGQADALLAIESRRRMADCIAGMSGDPKIFAFWLCIRRAERAAFTEAFAATPSRQHLQAMRDEYARRVSELDKELRVYG